MLHRIFPYLPGALETDEGGALFVPRNHQGDGRHDNPAHYGAVYGSRSAQSAVAERIESFRGRGLTDRDLQRADGKRYALVALDDSNLGEIVDLDDPAELGRRNLRPSAVATRHRTITQPIALSLFEEGAQGFGWWSTLEASWTNVTLFAERAIASMPVDEEPEPLHLGHPVLQMAAESIGVALLE